MNNCKLITTEENTDVYFLSKKYSSNNLWTYILRSEVKKIGLNFTVKNDNI